MGVGRFIGGCPCRPQWGSVQMGVGWFCRRWSLSTTVGLSPDGGGVVLLEVVLVDHSRAQSRWGWGGSIGGGPCRPQ